MPADTTSVCFPAQGGHTLVGVYYLAETTEPAPLAVLLHGFPGAEKNHDLAHTLRADGWHVLVPHFSGTWGSGGKYSFLTQPDDARSAVDYALSPKGDRPIDAHKVAVVGFSTGSRAAIMSALADERIGAVVSLAGFSDFSEGLLAEEFFHAVMPFVSGTSPAELKQEFVALGKGVQPAEAVKQLAPRPVLIVHGTEDEIVPFFHADAFCSGGEPHIHRVAIRGTNHVFARHRAELIMAVREFLNSWRTT